MNRQTKKKTKISRYYMEKQPVIAEKELLRRILAVQMRIQANEENIKNLLAQKRLSVIKLQQGDFIKMYHRTPDDFKQLEWTIQNLQSQNWKLKQELKILKSIKIYE